MLSELGGVETTRRLIHASALSKVFLKLAEKGRLDLTVEAIIVTELNWDPLFASVDREKARQHLRDHGYGTS